MKPSDFTINSDYLTLANVENRTYTATVSGAVIPSGGAYTLDYTFPCKAVGQTITRACMHHSVWNDSSLWGVGRSGSTAWTTSNNESIYESFLLTTPSDSTIKLSIRISGTAGAIVPAHTITIKVFRFKVPNVF